MTVDERMVVQNVLALVPAAVVDIEQTTFHSGMLSSYRAQPQRLAETAEAALAVDLDDSGIVHRFGHGLVHAGVGTSAQTVACKYLAAVAAAAALGR